MSDAIHNYLEIRKRMKAVKSERKRLDGEARILSEQLIPAWQETIPERMRSKVFETWPSASIQQALINEYVWLPLLVEEFDGNREAAETAWALGQRPAGYLAEDDE